MEEKIAVWSMAVIVAGFVALIIYGCTMDLFDGETIRKAAETGILLAASAVLATFPNG